MPRRARVALVPGVDPQIKRSYIAGLPDGMGKPTPIERPVTPEEICSFINRTKQLTNEAYESLVHDIGWRVALLVLREKAWSGNIRAISLYRDVVLQSREAKRKPTGQGNAAAMVFVQRERKPVGDEE